MLVQPARLRPRLHPLPQLLIRLHPSINPPQPLPALLRQRVHDRQQPCRVRLPCCLVDARRLRQVLLLRGLLSGRPDGPQRLRQGVGVVEGQRAARGEGAAMRVRGVADQHGAAAQEGVGGQRRRDGEVGVDADGCRRGAREEGADEGVPVLFAQLLSTF